MNKFGFIGYGHMGSALLNNFLATRALAPDSIIISTRITNKLDPLINQYPQIEIAEDNLETAQKSKVLFLCVGTLQVKAVLLEILPVLREDTHLILISGGLEIASVETLFSGAITKIIPTILVDVQEGVTLICHNQRVSAEAKISLEHLLEQIGKIKQIDEHLFEIGADFTSCAPGLLAAICHQYVQAGIAKGEFTYREAESLLLDTLLGTAKLLLETGEGFQALIGRVATHGGATEGGVNVLEQTLPEVFQQVFAATLLRHEQRKQITREQFLNPHKPDK